MSKKNKQPLVVIFGRTNVGKSTLFNCLVEKHKALVSEIEGTTRDSNIDEVNWQGYNFKLIDTGGIMDVSLMHNPKTKSTDIDVKVQLHAADYLRKADLILFLVDSKAGLLPTDKEMVKELKVVPHVRKIREAEEKIDEIKVAVLIWSAIILIALFISSDSSYFLLDKFSIFSIISS